MAVSVVPKVRELDERDIHAFLARNYVGRIAYAAGERIEIRPIHYVYSSGLIYGRTSYGAKFEQIDARSTAVAFEVDEIESMFRWKSVIVHGKMAILHRDDPDPAEWERATQLLRRLIPDTFTDHDPVPERVLVLRIEVQESSGRAMEVPVQE